MHYCHLEAAYLCPRFSVSRCLAQLFQSREGLFGQVPTEYDQILRVRKALEPYANLWSTAEEWLKSYEAWTKGSFLAIDAEILEADVERLVQPTSPAAFLIKKGTPVEA